MEEKLKKMAELFKDVIIESGILNVTKKVDIP